MKTYKQEFKEIKHDIKLLSAVAQTNIKDIDIIQNRLTTIEKKIEVLLTIVSSIDTKELICAATIKIVSNIMEKNKIGVSDVGIK